MKTAPGLIVLCTVLLFLAASAVALAGERHFIKEGWYRFEEGYGEPGPGEAPSSGVIIEQDDDDGESAPPAQPEGSDARIELPPPPLGADEDAEERERAARPGGLDCDYVRGSFLARVLELRGVQRFWNDPRELAPLASGPKGGVLCDGAKQPCALSWLSAEPALALLNGEVPVPPGALSFDFELRSLAPEVLRCAALGAQGR